ncbi:MAG: FKBP-type peptidyl-prolyl cis-trans isomerase, partial [Alphaproteobacteria bacterium]|nr:FKBP-type peptidyl-prolyl cis-trans isomerase [Alphaproteobacteria bacterium]
MSEAKSGDTVRLHYTGTLTDGSRFDSSEGRDPLEFTLGGGQIIPGLEREIFGMKLGDKKTVTAVADEAYGQPNPAALQDVPRDTIPPEIELAIGGQLQVSSPEGQQMTVTITAITDDVVTMDANHP